MFKPADEVFLDEKECIITETDLLGNITFANPVFFEVSGYTENQVMGQPHSIIRHKFMPHSVFHMMWDSILNDQDIYAYVINKTIQGGHYWVFAHVVPRYDAGGELIGFRSWRHTPNRVALEKTIIPFYEQLNKIERNVFSHSQGIQEALHYLRATLAERAENYEDYILNLERTAA